MQEIIGNIWDYHDKGHWIVITTNGNTNINGDAVMGKGIAWQAKQRYPNLPKLLAEKINRWGNHTYLFRSPISLITFPTKEDWKLPSSLSLIAQSAFELMIMWEDDHFVNTIYLVRPGCGAGELDWKDVKPILEKYLDDRFVVVERG